MYMYVSTYTCTCIAHIIHMVYVRTLMSLERSNKLATLTLQLQHVDLTAVVSYEDVIAALVIGHVHTPCLCLKPPQ